VRELTHLYVHSGSIGYGRMGSEITAALEADGVDVYDHLGDNPDGYAQQGQIRGVRTPREGERTHKMTNLVAWSSTPSHAMWWWKGQHAAIITMFESSVLPEAFRESLHNFDTLIVPSEQNVELFSRFHPNVHLMPLGVNPDVWHYEPRTTPGRYFNFLIGGSGARKGTDLAHRAFMHVFGNWKGDGPEPRLVMKNPRGESFDGPMVQMASGLLTPEQEVAIYQEAHVYLQPSRGEGFGLQPLQAMAQGIPTILTNAHGHAGFASLGYGLDAKPSKANYFIYGDAGEWWEPDFDQLCDYMRLVYDDYETARKVGHAAALEVAEHWTWANTAQRFQEILGPQMEEPYSGDHTYVFPESKEYPAVLIRDWNADIAGTSYAFEGGTEYYVTADVKRILFEANLLDPVCLNENVDTGLTPDQLERLGVYRAINAYCPACGLRRGDARSRGEELDEIAGAVDPWADALMHACKLYPELTEDPKIQAVMW
jgi:hypothetical protein